MPLTLDDDTLPGNRGRATGGLNGPGQLDGPAGAQAGFDLQGATTLYWKPVPLLLRHADREDQHEELTFRILTGVSRSNHSMRVLRIHISSESDLFFMHSLEVSEEDFQSLKTEQGILVDFASFPMKIITLLDKCTSIQPVDAPRFQAVLTVRGGESLFRIVETNDFKQLPHITLAFRPGNDSAVKQFLAFRLLEVKSDVEELRTQLAASQAAHNTSSSDLKQVKQQLSVLQEQYDKHMLEVQAEAKTQRAQDLEQRAKERADTKEAHDKEVSELRHRHSEVVETLNNRIQQLDAENRKLREAKYELDTKVSELSARLGSAEGANRSLDEECARLRAMAAQLGGDKAEKEVLANDLKARLSAAEEKASSQAEMVEAQRARVRDLEAGMRQVEGRCSELKESLAATEARLRDTQAEVSKGNTIIDKLANDLRVAKEKAKRKQAILVRQEEAVKQRDTALAGAERDQQTLQASMDTLKSEVGSLHAENAELRSKLEDSKQQLQSNEQMIRWLNQQVTEAQLGSAAGGLLPNSRYVPYRPALTGPPGTNAGTNSSTLVSDTPGSALLPAPALPSGHAAAVVAAAPGSNAIGSSIASKYSSRTLAGGAADTGTGLPGTRPSYMLPSSPGPATQPRYSNTSSLPQAQPRFDYATPAPSGGRGPGTTTGLGQASAMPMKTPQLTTAAGAPSSFFGR